MIILINCESLLFGKNIFTTLHKIKIATPFKNVMLGGGEIKGEKLLTVMSVTQFTV